MREVRGGGEVVTQLFFSDEEKEIDNHATFRRCMALDCHSFVCV